MNFWYIRKNADFYVKKYIVSQFIKHTETNFLQFYIILQEHKFFSKVLIA